MLVSAGCKDMRAREQIRCRESDPADLDIKRVCANILIALLRA